MSEEPSAGPMRAEPKRGGEKAHSLFTKNDTAGEVRKTHDLGAACACQLSLSVGLPRGHTFASRIEHDEEPGCSDEDRPLPHFSVDGRLGTG